MYLRDVRSTQAARRLMTPTPWPQISEANLGVRPKILLVEIQKNQKGPVTIALSSSRCCLENNPVQFLCSTSLTCSGTACQCASADGQFPVAHVNELRSSFCSAYEDESFISVLTVCMGTNWSHCATIAKGSNHDHYQKQMIK